MTETTSQKPPVWFWVIPVIALVWNGMGANVYLQSAFKTDAYKAMYTPEELEIAANLPAYVTAAFAIAVFAGVLASLLLLFRNRKAYVLFILSLIGIIVQMGYTLLNGFTSNMAITLTTIILGVVLVWFSKRSIQNHWLK